MKTAKAILFAVLVLAACPARCAAGQGITIERGGQDDGGRAAERARLARTLYTHNFENLRDPDTGMLLPASAALAPEQWPDFWEPVRAVGFPEYLIPEIRVVEDDSGMIPGAYRDVRNHVLEMNFDGTRVGIRTKSPVPINPALAYEYSIRVRDDGLEGARIRTGVDWMRIDPAAAEVLRSDEIGTVRPGQTDWAVLPSRILVNDPPPSANAARFFVVIDRDPDSVGGAYHGRAWLDDIALKPLPKIRVDAPQASGSGRAGRIIPVHYSGLFDNVPDPANPGYFRGKIYSRQVEITDVFGQPVTLGPGRRGRVNSEEDGTAVEELAFPRDRYGVYYFNIRLYDAENRLLTDVMRSAAVMPPPGAADGLQMNAIRPAFGVSAGVVPDEILSSSGFLRRILERSGVKTTKIVPWRDSYSGGTQNDGYYKSVVEEVRRLRSAGVGIIGVIQPPEGMFGGRELLPAVTDHNERLNEILREAGRNLGLFVDGWQWGADNDPGLSLLPADGNIQELAGTLQDFTGGMPVVGNTVLGKNTQAKFPVETSTTQAYLPDSIPATNLWRLAAPVFPRLFDPYYLERGQIYPPRSLSSLAEPPPQDQLEVAARKRDQRESWISVEAPPAPAHEPNAAAERAQMEEVAIKGIYATILAPETVFLGNLFDPEHGMLRRDVSGANILETMARPAFLATMTLSKLLEGAEYLGRIWLLAPFEAHAFRHPGSDESVIAIWHTDSREEIPFPREQIANGPALELIDWAGNVAPAGTSIPVRRAPTFIRGLSANLLLTRMSLRINPDQHMMAVGRRQNQTVEMINHLPRQVPALLRLQYAARYPDGAMENGWGLRPEEMRLNLSPYTPQLTAGMFRYAVNPDPNSQIQFSSPAGVDKSGSKIAQARVSFNMSPPADMTVFLPFRLHSDFDVDIERLSRVDDVNFITLMLKIRWFPLGAERRRGDVRLMPYYMKQGQMREQLPFPTVVKASDPAERGNPNAPFESVELRIPKRPMLRTWVGLTEAGGSNFYLIDVTEHIMAE